jgi:chromosome partitioning protein
VSQKGGVGKSTIARLLACEYAHAGWQAKIADLDIAEGTSFSWQARCCVTTSSRWSPSSDSVPSIRLYDWLSITICSSSMARRIPRWYARIAQASDLVLLPSCFALDDLEPSLLLAQELVQKGISASKLTVAFLLGWRQRSRAEQGARICGTRWVARRYERDA